MQRWDIWGWRLDGKDLYWFLGFCLLMLCFFAVRSCMTLGETSRSWPAWTFGGYQRFAISYAGKIQVGSFLLLPRVVSICFLLLRMSEEERKLNTAARIVAVGVEFATSSCRCVFSLFTQQHKACMRKSWVVLSQESGPSLFFGGLPVPRSSTSIRSM